MINARNNARNSIAMKIQYCHGKFICHGKFSCHGKSIVMENSFVTKGFKPISMIKLLMFRRLTQQRNGKSNAPTCHKVLQAD